MKTTKTARKSSKSKAVKQGADTFRKTFSISTALNPSQGLSVTNYLKYFFSPYNPNGSVLLRDQAEFRAWANMYDRYRIDGVSIRIIPRVNSVTQTTMGSSYNNSSGVYFITMDRDSVAPSSIVALKRYKSTRVVSQIKGAKASYRVKWPKSFWLDTTNDLNPTQNNTMACQIGAVGGITVYAENVTEPSGALTNHIWADCEIKFRCSFQTYNPRSMTLDPETGAVTIEAPTDLDDSSKPVLPVIMADVVGEVTEDELPPAC